MEREQNEKNVALFLAALMMVSLTACGTSEVSEQSSEPKAVSVEDQDISVVIQSWSNDGKETSQIERSGKYTGETIDEVPNGEGRFDTVNDKGEAWSYTGHFKDGVFDGDGCKTWSSTSYVEDGNYTDGKFTPTTADLFRAYAYSGSIFYDVSDETLSVINDNQTCFPCKTDSDRESLKSMCDETVVYKQIDKSIDSYLGTVVHLKDLQVIQIYEGYAYGNKATYILASDPKANFCYICYPGTLPEVYEDSRIDAYAMVLSQTSFDNISGGTTLALVFAGGIVDLIAS